MKSNFVYSIRLKLVAAVGVLTAPVFAFADAGPNFSSTGAVTIGGMANNASTSMTGVYGMISNGALVGGIGLATTGIYLLYQSKKDEGRTKMTQGAAALVAGALMVFMPSMIEGVAATTFGSGPAVQAQSTMH